MFIMNYRAIATIFLHNQLMFQNRSNKAIGLANSVLDLSLDPIPPAKIAIQILSLLFSNLKHVLIKLNNYKSNCKTISSIALYSFRIMIGRPSE